jgi:hypothetical protein
VNGLQNAQRLIMKIRQMPMKELADSFLKFSTDSNELAIIYQ